jgi:hypothetical protein
MTSIFVTIAVLLRIFSNPFANVFQKKLTGSYVHALFVNFATYALLAIACLTGLLFMPPAGILLSAAFWKWSLLSAICGALGNAFLVKAADRGFYIAGSSRLDRSFRSGFYHLGKLFCT